MGPALDAPPSETKAKPSLQSAEGGSEEGAGNTDRASPFTQASRSPLDGEVVAEETRTSRRTSEGFGGRRQGSPNPARAGKGGRDSAQAGGSGRDQRGGRSRQRPILRGGWRWQLPVRARRLHRQPGLHHLTRQGVAPPQQADRATSPALWKDELLPPPPQGRARRSPPAAGRGGCPQSALPAERCGPLSALPSCPEVRGLSPPCQGRLPAAAAAARAPRAAPLKLLARHTWLPLRLPAARRAR